jgi:four helix bundle protein
MSFVKDFTELETYKLARKISFEIFQLTKIFPPEEKYSLTDQIRRSSRSVGAQIAESWGKRRFEKHFISKLNDADAEIMETQHWLATAEECEYISHEEFNLLNNQCELLSKKINSMILKATQFCNLNKK